MLRASLVAVVFVFVVACIFVAPCQQIIPFPVEESNSAYCRGFSEIPGNLPTSLVEVFVLGVFFSTFPALLGLVASRTSASQAGSHHLRTQYVNIINSITNLLSGDNVDRPNEVRKIKNTLSSLKSESKLASSLFSQPSQEVLYKDFQSQFANLVDNLPKVDKPNDRIVTDAYEAQSSFEDCGNILGELFRSTHFLHLGYSRFAKIGRELDDLISTKYAGLPPSAGSTEDLSYNQMLRLLLANLDQLK